MFKLMIRDFLRSIWYELVHGGETYLYDLEVVVLKNMLASMEGANKDCFLQQLNRLDLIQRSPDGRIVTLFEARDTYFKSWDNILLDNKKDYFLAYKAKVSGDICPKNSLTIEVFFHRGRIGTIEYKRKMEWPVGQKKIQLRKIDWLFNKGGELNIENFELFL
ncbi:hypothetical protein [Microbulbifer sp. TYP-18]|uniref:hypothetical protein n=1 Tax=Microbulbifer sp. TYP-18 TaxID=3230024 RepID=UPI0034C64BA1